MTLAGDPGRAAWPTTGRDRRPDGAASIASGEVECVAYEPAHLASDAVRIRTVRSPISPGTEMTFYGRAATNVYLHKHWNDELRLFEPGRAERVLPGHFGYRAAGEVVESAIRRRGSSARGCRATGVTPSSSRCPRRRPRRSGCRTI